MRPNGIAVAPNGTLYVMDRGHSRVVHLSAEGQVIDTIGRLGRGPADIYSGWDLGLDSAGNIYLCHQVFDVEGFSESLQRKVRVPADADDGH